MKIFSFFCLAVLSLFSRPLEVEVSARSAIVMNADTGAILYEKNPYIPMYPASTTKIATALYVLEQKNPDLEQMMIVSSEALKIKPEKGREEVPAYWGEVGGSKMGLMKGEVLPLEALLHGLMRVSGNDAANVIAENLCGSIPDFVAEMNQYIQFLGCKNTHFCNPHGLHHEEHLSTAYDMCLIMQRALQNPKFREIVSNNYYQKPKTNKQPAAEIEQKNPLLKPGKYYHSKVIGAKTGFHSKAKYTLVAVAEEEGRTLIAVLFGCDKRVDRYEDAMRLFDLAFGEKKETSVFFDRSHPFSYSIEGAKTPLQAHLKEDLSVSYFPSEEPTCRAFVHWEPMVLPIYKGQKVGEVHISDSSGVVLQSGDLIAKEDVKSTFVHLLKQMFL